MHNPSFEKPNHEYSINPKLYLDYRPNYNQKLFEYIASLVPHKGLAWDCATGNGQAADMLANYFDQVVATDINQEQLDYAILQKNITYKQSNELNPDLEDNSVDLITVATAIHWLDTKLFYKEVERVLKPGGLLALWGYTGKHINSTLDPTLDKIIQKYLINYYPNCINIAFGGYKNLEFPYKKIQTPSFRVHKEWTFDELINYIMTWSASQNYIAQNNASPLYLFEQELKEAWGDLSQKKVMTWELITYFGKKK